MDGTMKVSIIINAKNEEKSIPHALEYWLNQTHKDTEIIVVDNKSTDRTPEVVREYMKRYKNIMLIEGEGKGLAAARNQGFKHARGEVVIWSDADMHPELRQDTLLESIVREFERDRDVDVVFTDYEIFFTGKLLTDAISIYQFGPRLRAFSHMAEAFRRDVWRGEMPVGEGLDQTEDTYKFIKALENARKVSAAKEPRLMYSGIETLGEFKRRCFWYGVGYKNFILKMRNMKSLMPPVINLLHFVAFPLALLSILDLRLLLPFVSLIILQYLRQVQVLKSAILRKRLIAWLLAPWFLYLHRILFTIGFLLSLVKSIEYYK